MAKPLLGPVKPKTRSLKKTLLVGTFAVLATTTVGALLYTIGSQELRQYYQSMRSAETAPAAVAAPVSFPVSVDPSRKLISENPNVDLFYEEAVPAGANIARGGSYTLAAVIFRAFEKITLSSWYQNLANPVARVLVIDSGERKEEIAKHFGEILGWNSEQKSAFLEAVATATPAIADGKFYPGTYVAARGAKPEEMAAFVNDRFNSEVLTRYGPEVEEIVPLEDALTIASLLEREAYDFEDMRRISGVIWNRLFADMNLQIDATLQYVKGSKPSQAWWPQVRPSDKFLASPYNTYENGGLPPAPIANPSVDAIIAALNPRKTDCMYYFHDRNADFHCSLDYQGHVDLLKQYYGRGR